MRYSRQRAAVVNELRGRRDHPTAEIIYHALRQEHPAISLGTVYRNLSLLESRGEVQRLCSQGGPDRYDGDTAPHEHLHCKECGALVDLMGLEYVVDLPAAQEMAARQGLVVEGHQLNFIGLCSVCASNRRRSGCDDPVG